MAISQYWVGQIPARPIAITVRDSKGDPVDLSGYGEFSVRLLGSDDEFIDLTGAELQTAGAVQGRFVFVFPRDRSLFETHGDYLLQLELDGGGVRDFTTAHNIRVHKLGGVR